MSWCSSQSLYEVMITLIGMLWKKEALNKLSLLEINTYTKTFEKILPYFLERSAHNFLHLTPWFG